MASCAFLLTIIFLSTFAFYSAKGEGADPEPTPEASETSDPTLGTDKTLYAAGETVIFSGTGYDAGSYEIDITLIDNIIVTLSFAPTDLVADLGEIPDGVSWTIPSNAEDGTYVALVYKIVDNVRELESVVSTEFKVATALVAPLTELEKLVTSEGVTAERYDSLMASLSNAARKIEFALALLEEGKSRTAMNQLRAARNMLTAFIHKVMAQSGKIEGIEVEIADDLIEKATAYIVYIDSMIVSTLGNIDSMTASTLPTGKQLALNIQRILQKQETHLNKFMLRNSLSQTDDEPGAVELADSAEDQIQSTIERAKGKAKKLMALYAEGEIDGEQLVMGLEECNLETAMAEELAELMVEELNSRSYGTQGKRFGQYIQLAKDLLSDVEALENSSHGNGNQGNGVGKGNNNGIQGTGAEDVPLETQNPGKAKGRQSDGTTRRHGPK